MRTLSVLASLSLLIACGGSDKRSDTSTSAQTSVTTTETTTTATTSVTTYTPDWDGVSAMMSDHCNSCHVSGGTAGFSIEDRIAEDLVSGEGRYVVANNPDDSLLWRVLTGVTLEVDPVEVMPQGSGPLPAANTQHVREWIANGASQPFNAADLDGDGFSVDDGDCDDFDNTRNPGADEVCGDNVDNNCDTFIDDATSVDTTPWFLDDDADGFGDTTTEVLACDAPADHVEFGDDCNDADNTFFPGAPETDCTDPNDYNCDSVTGFTDSDGDGWAACEECDDTNGLINPDADEICGDNLDNDCDSATDDPSAIDALTWYADLDEDGHGDLTAPSLACTQQPFTASLDDDCDDNDGDNFPLNPEVCDLQDNDCDDNDGDNFPLNPEVCDLQDNDCDSLPDNNATDADDWYLDGDGDGFGAGPLLSTECGPVGGQATNDRDCNDALDTSNPDAPELPGDGEDNNCNGAVDEGPLFFLADIQPILNANCTGCHGGTFPSSGMDLSGNAFAVLVNVASQDVPTMSRITPNDPANSYLWNKINNTHLAVGGAGVSMPRSQPLLPQATRDTLEAWILDGAQP